MKKFLFIFMMFICLLFDCGQINDETENVDKHYTTISDGIHIIFVNEVLIRVSVNKYDWQIIDLTKYIKNQSYVTIEMREYFDSKCVIIPFYNAYSTYYVKPYNSYLEPVEVQLKADNVSKSFELRTDEACKIAWKCSEAETKNKNAVLEIKLVSYIK